MMKTYWPLFFLFVFWFIFSFPFFFQQKVPYPSTHQVNAFSPWSRYSQYASPIKNDALPDVIDQIYPWKYFAIQELKKGSIPLWNPYSFSGTPHMANFQSGVFSPFNLLYFIFSFVDAWSLVVLLQPLLAGIFTYMYMQRIGISRVGSLIASVSFMFSGFMVVWMAYGTLGMAVTFLPLILYCIEVFFDKKSLLSLVGVSLGVATSFLSGHFQTSIYVFGVAILYVAWKVFILKHTKQSMWVVVYLFLGLLLAMPQLLPSIELYQFAPRSSGFTGSSGIPFYNLVTIVAPDFFGNPVTRNNVFMDYAEWMAFIGSIPFMLSFFAFSYTKKKTLAHFFILLGILALLFSIQSPLQNIVASLHIPVLSTSTQSRVIIIFSFSFALLAGFGMDQLQTFLKEKQYKAIGIRSGIIFALIAGIWIAVLVGGFLSDQHLQIAKKNFILPTAFICLALLGIGGVLLSKRKILWVGLSVFFLTLTAFDSFRFATKWMPFDPKNLVFPEEKITNLITKEMGNGRVFGNIGQEMTMYYRLPTVGGYDPLYIQRYGEFIASGVSGTYTQSGGRTVMVDKTSKHTDKILNLLGVHTIVHPVADTNAVWAYPVWNKAHMKQTASDGAYAIYSNNNALPRAKMFYDFQTIGNKELLIKQFYNPAFDYANTLLLEEQSPVKPNRNVQNNVSITSYTSNKVEIKVSTQKDGLLFLSDVYYPGWNAYVDGKQTPILRANYTFRAVSVPSGAHTVIFTYMPVSFHLGSIIGFFGAIGLGSYPLLRKALKHS